MQVRFTEEEIRAIVQPKASRGATRQTIHGIAALDSAAAGDISFLGNPRYKPQVSSTRASIVLLPADFVGEPVENQLFLLVDQPSAALAKLCARVEQTLWPKPVPGVHASASVAADAWVPKSATIGPLCVIESGAVIGEGCHLQAQVFIGRGARLGENCWLMPGTVVASHCTLGNRVRLQPGVIVGSDGFGYEPVEGRHEKVPQVGTVEIGDDVEIGANSTLDRARFSRTHIGEGTKIDNLVQVGHNVIVGKHCILCAQVGISGSTVLEDYVVLAGQVGVGGHVRIGKGAKAGGQCGITADIPAGANVNGTVALPFMLERRIQVLKQKLPELFRRVDELEAAIRR